MKQLFNNINNNKKKAFTLIELLIVIAIIGILSGAVIVAMSGTQESAIDSRIKASMAQLRSSIEIYGLVNGANYTGLESDSEISLLIDDIESQVGTPTVNISGSGDKYCLSTNLKSSNELWCIDSAGFAGLGGCINYSCDTSLGYSSGGIPISTGLVGYWTMDEGSLLSPNTIRDYSPYGNTGTIYGATFATDRHGQSNKAMSFDGVDDYINCGNGASLNIADVITVEVWVKTSDTRGIILIKEDGGSWVNLKYSLWCNGALMAYYNGTNTISSGVYPSGDWQHIMFTYDKNLESANLKIYIDGVLKNTKNYTTPLNTGGNLYLGTWKNDPSYAPFNGLIDDVRIYNRALSAEEITFLYNSSR